MSGAYLSSLAAFARGRYGPGRPARRLRIEGAEPADMDDPAPELATGQPARRPSSLAAAPAALPPVAAEPAAAKPGARGATPDEAGQDVSRAEPDPSTPAAPMPVRQGRADAGPAPGSGDPPPPSTPFAPYDEVLADPHLALRRRPPGDEAVSAPRPDPAEPPRQPLRDPAPAARAAERASAADPVVPRQGLSGVRAQPIPDPPRPDGRRDGIEIGTLSIRVDPPSPPPTPPPKPARARGAAVSEAARLRRAATRRL